MAEVQVNKEASLENGWIELMTHLYRVLMTPMPSNTQLTKSQRMALLCLSGGEALSMSQLAAFLSSSREQATRVVSALVDAQLVERTTDPANRSRVLVKLSEQGNAAMADHREQMSSTIRQQLDALSPSDRSELRKSLFCVAGFLKQINEQK